MSRVPIFGARSRTARGALCSSCHFTAGRSRCSQAVDSTRVVIVVIAVLSLVSLKRSLDGLKRGGSEVTSIVAC